MVIMLCAFCCAHLMKKALETEVRGVYAKEMIVIALTVLERSLSRPCPPSFNPQVLELSLAVSYLFRHQGTLVILTPIS